MKSISNRETCYGCGGSGNDDMDATMYCPVCAGSGELAASGPQPNVTTDDCWTYAGHIDKTTGYGSMYDRGLKRTVKAHRAVYEALVGEIPEGLVIDHLCMNKCCINPEHLEVVTYKENNLRALELYNHWLRKPRTHCKRGHELTEDNINWRKGIYPQCRTCKNACNASYRERLEKAAS